jgi:hypothetical protein
MLAQAFLTSAERWLARSAGNEISPEWTVATPESRHTTYSYKVSLVSQPAALLVLVFECCQSSLRVYIFTNTQEVTTHSAAPSKCIHSSNQKFDTDKTSTGKQSITSNYHTTLLHTFICRHPHASPAAGTTAPSEHANRCTIREEIPPTQAHTQLAQSAINK